MSNVDTARLWCEEHLFKKGKLSGDNWTCCSPLRDEQNESFSVSVTGRSYHDFTTDERGTLTKLAGLMGVEPPQWEPEEPREEKNSSARAKADKSDEAARLWKTGKPAQADHGYLVRKKIGPHGCREATIGGERVLLVPAYGEAGALAGLERIWPDGRKKHLGEKSGAFLLLGELSAGRPVVLTEGFATGASVHEATGYATVVCFGAANVPTLVRRLREQYPDIELVAATDNDDAGRNAAAACPAGTLAVIPDGATHCDWCDVACLMGADETRKLFDMKLESARGEAPELPKKKDSLGLMFYDELVYTEPEYLVARLIEKHSVGLLFGATATKKSFIALDIAASVATGRAFHGRVTEQGAVVYLAGEGARGIGRRLKAWEQHFGVSLKGAPLLVSMRAPKFGDPRSAKEAVDDIREKLRERGITGAALVVVDTLARAAVGLDENSNQDMAEFVAVLDSLKDELGCVVLAIHHSGYVETARARGASCVPAAMDFIFAAKADGPFVTLTATKVKEAEEPTPVMFECVTETIGAGRYGEPLTSLVLEEVDASPRGKAKPLTPAQQLGLDSFREAARKAGTLDVQLEQWREAFYAGHTGDSPEAKRKAFIRARKDLVELGKLSVRDDVYREAGEIADLIRDETAKRDTGQSGTLAGHVPLGTLNERDKAGHTPIGVSRCPACVPAENDTGEEKEECPAVDLPDKKEPEEVSIPRGESDPGALIRDPAAPVPVKPADRKAKRREDREMERIFKDAEPDEGLSPRDASNGSRQVEEGSPSRGYPLDAVPEDVVLPCRIDDGSGRERWLTRIDTLSTGRRYFYTSRAKTGRNDWTLEEPVKGAAS